VFLDTSAPSTPSGWRRVDGTWRSWQPPCAGAVHATLAASSDARLVVVRCSLDATSTGGPGLVLWASTDGGDTFHRLPAPPFVRSLSSDGTIAVDDDRAIIVSYVASDGKVRVERTIDEGAHWVLSGRKDVPDLVWYRMNIAPDGFSFAWLGGGVAVSSDSGATFVPLPAP
jgi:hypothetical protein